MEYKAAVFSCFSQVIKKAQSFFDKDGAIKKQVACAGNVDFICILSIPSWKIVFDSLFGSN
ncbi:MAG: hypothetical protein LIP10_11790 [Clostridiales bacterium]|nr:hypothetical protein [Clostridiales bacterium]